MNTDTLDIYEGALRRPEDVSLTPEQASMFKAQRELLNLIPEAPRPSFLESIRQREAMREEMEKANAQ